MHNRAWTLLLVAATWLASSPCRADWDIEIGDANSEVIHSVQQTRDGGYIVAAWVGYSGTPDSYDFGVLKLGTNAAITWQKIYGEELDDRPYSIRETFDGGFIVAGHKDGCWTAGCGDGTDIWTLKLHADGAVAWQKSYGRPGNDWAYAIRQTDDGGYILVGTTTSIFEEPEPSGTYRNIWVIKLGADGEGDWQKVLKWRSTEIAHTIEQTDDGGYVLAGYSGREDLLRVIKLHSDGAIDWQLAYPGLGGYHVTSAIQQTSDHGYIVTATTVDLDVWVARLRPDGTTSWQNTYDAGHDERSLSVRQTSDGGFLVAGNTCAPVPCYPLDPDIWLLKLDSEGAIQWEKLRQGAFNIFSSSPIEQTWDGGYIVGGRTLAPGVTADTDMLLLKVDGDGEIADSTCSSLVDHASTVSASSIEPFATNLEATETAVASSNTSITPLDAAYEGAFNCFAEPIELFGTVGDVTASEGHSGVSTFSFTVDLSPAPHTPITVDFVTDDGTAEAPTDYTASSGSLVFEPTVSSKSIDVEVLGDITREPNETFFVGLSGANPIVYIDDEGRGKIVNDDFEANLTLTKSASWELAPPGGPLTYYLSVTNSGPDDATDVTLTDPLPEDLILVGLTPSAPNCIESGGTVTCSWNAIPQQAGQTVVIEGVVAATATGVLANTAKVYAVEADPNPVDNTATEGTQVGSVPWAVILDGEAIDSAQTYEACYSITMLDSAIVVPGGLRLRASGFIALGDGVMVENSCELEVSITPVSGCP